MKTADVKKLVTKVLKDLPEPYSPHVIDEVLHKIETTPKWRIEYDDLCRDLGKRAVNISVGRWTGSILGLKGRQVPSHLNSLSKSYSILDTLDIPPAKPPKEPEASRIMYEFHKENKHKLHPEIAKCREEIIAGIVSGLSVEEAFAIAEENLRRIIY
jgi:hypothetical protein